MCAPAGWRPSRVRIGIRLDGEPGSWAGVGGLGVGGLGVGGQGARTHLVLDAGALAAWPSLAPQTGLSHVVVPGGEAVKDFATLEVVLRSFVDAGHDRGSVVLVVGGGAVCDLGGLAAALALRGVDLVLVPTTLLAMVDAAVGGKTAIDLPEGKNLVGAFWPAREVWIDPRFMSTEPDEQFRSGLAEVIKVAIGLDRDLFDLCERQIDAIVSRDAAVMREIVRRAVTAKIGVVERDPGEQGERRLLNLGHTLGHALEAHGGFRRPHGLAIAQGLHHVIELAESTGTLAAPLAERCRQLLTRLGFQREPWPSPAELLPYVLRDKKAAGGALRAVLPTGLGTSRIDMLTARAFLRLE